MTDVRRSDWRSIPFEQALLVLLGLLLAVRCQWISDDGYIYLTYVENLVVHGHGPVFNPGERVEGYTSVAWLALLAGARWISGNLAGELLSPRQLALLLGHACYVTALLLAIRVDRLAREAYGIGAAHVRRLSEWNIPLIWLACLTPFHHFATSGLETPLIVLYGTLVAGFVLGASRSVTAAATLVALGPLVRPDLALFALAVLVVAFARLGFWRGVLVGLLALIPNLGIEAARIGYYAALLPNTFYAKTGIEGAWPQGWFYLQDMMLSYGLHWIFVIALLAVLAKSQARRATGEAANRLTLLATAAAYGAYVLSVGGDFMHGRFWLPTLVMLGFAFAGLGGDALATSLAKRNAGVIVTTRLAAGLLLAGLLLSLQPIQIAVAAPQQQQVFHGVSSELHGYRARNPALHSWSGNNAHPWATQGRTLGALADRLNIELGIPAGGIGQRAFHGQRTGPVYVYDQLALTRPTVARIDMGGIPRRIGHKKLAPTVLYALHPRVDFCNLYFDGYGDVFGVRATGLGRSLVNLSLIPELTQHGYLSEAEAESMRSWLRKQLTSSPLDANLLVFLRHRLPADDGLMARVRTLHDRFAAQSRWHRWLQANHITLSQLSDQVTNAGEFRENLAIAWRNHHLDSIPYVSDGPDWVMPTVSAERSLLTAALWAHPDDRKISLDWAKGQLVGEFALAPGKHLYVSTGAEPFEKPTTHERLRLARGRPGLCEIAGSVQPAGSVVIFILEYDESGTQVSKRSWEFTGELAARLPRDPRAASFRVAIRVERTGRFRFDQIRLLEGVNADSDADARP